MPDKDRSPYGSHMPFLSRIMEMTSGPVLELGMGLFSTPLLHMMAHLQQRQLISYDNDPEWFAENKKWASEFHTVKFIENDDWDSADILDRHWSVVFVDHKPAKRRMVELKRLANNANFVLVHDSEQSAKRYFKYHWAYPFYKFRYDYTLLTPNTTVLSNFIDVSKFLG